MHSNNYVTIYTLVMTLIVSIGLAFVVTALKPMHQINEEVYKKKDILGAIADYVPGDLSSMSSAQILDLFNSRMEQVVLDAKGNVVEGEKAESIDLAAEEKKPADQRKYPLFIFKGDEGKIYLTSVRGNGLWDKVWGYIAFQEDLNTIVGASFGHVGETPGLGAEIKDNPAFPAQFKGKKIYQDGEYVSVAVVKGGAKNPEHEVDGISGATITSVGVSNMLYAGIEAYLPYFKTLQAAN